MFPKNSGGWQFPAASKSSSVTAACRCVKIRTPWSAAEIYPHGAHVTHFQKNGEPPLIFMSAKSNFAPGKPIRGGVPVCFPWFGPREGEPAHGSRAPCPWKLAETSAAPDGRVTARLCLPQNRSSPNWAMLRTEFVLTVGDTLTMELIAVNESLDKTVAIENCLHTYLQVADINAVALAGLQGAAFDDFAFGANGARDPAIRPVADHAGDEPRLSRQRRRGGNARRKIEAHPPRGKIRLAIHRRLESVDDAKNAGRLGARTNTGKWSAWNPAT